MKQGIILTGLTVLAFLVALTAFRPGIISKKANTKSNIIESEVSACGPKSTAENLFAGRRFIPLPGWGSHSYKVTTSSDSAQFYFDQGLNLFYSFHLGESQSSFLEAQRHDSTCAMAYWGYAMASGPIINNTVYNFTDKNIVAQLAKAYDLATDQLEKDLIKAQQTRYVANDTLKRRNIFITYRDAMKSVHEKYKDNVEVATLYADAAMMVDARNWYDVSGKPYDGTDDIIQTLEQIIAKKPDHPAALHYYIHMVETSHTPGRAREASDRLMYMLPSVTHMVHMPSHIYIRTGDYKKGILSNQLAVKGYDLYKQTISNGWEGSRHLYLYHNADMQGSNALLMGNYKATKEAFQINAKRFNKSDVSSYTEGGYGHYVQFLTVQPYLLNVRFGKWSALLAEKSPVSNNTAHKIYWHFGRGMAQAKTKRLAEAHASLNAMKELMKDASLEARLGLRSRTIDIMQVPAAILEGTIAMAEKRKDDAIRFLNNAVAAEDTLHYAEPESWRLPARHFLGQAYLATNKYKEAQKVFEEDLIDHPFNFWSANGLSEALYGSFQLPERSAVRKKYAEVFKAADIKLKGSAY